METHHFLLVCFPAQGHINPSLQLAKRLISFGVHVTLATTVSATRLIKNNKHHLPPPGLSFTSFSDGFDEGFDPKTNDVNHYFSELKRNGQKSLADFIISKLNDDDDHHHRPITFVIYSLLLTWAADVASSFRIPSALLFIQPATLLTLYYHYFHGYRDEICSKINDNNDKDRDRDNDNDDVSLSLELPGLPLLSSRDLPSFLSPTSSHGFILNPMKEQIEFLDQKIDSVILLNTFTALEKETLRAISELMELKLIPIGPLIPSAFLGGRDSSDTSFGCDLFQGSNADEYMEWLNSKPKSSVIYVSFGTVFELSDEQVEEVLQALLESGYAFLWTRRSKQKNEKGEITEGEKVKNMAMAAAEEMKMKLGERGKIVAWCNQVDVLTHRSLGCFITHCGWNSTIESLATGLPVIAFPQQVDQVTNAKMIEDVWKTGVRVKGNAHGIVEREEIKRCLDLVMRGGAGDGDGAGAGAGVGEEIRQNANKWKELARQAVSDGGSSDLNLKSFLTQIYQ